MPLEPTFEAQVFAELTRLGTKTDIVNLLRAELLLLAIRPDPDEPELIDPVSWLKNMIDYCREHPPAEDEDLDAYWMMIDEVQGLHDRVRLALKDVQ